MWYQLENIKIQTEIPISIDIIYSYLKSMIFKIWLTVNIASKYFNDSYSPMNIIKIYI